MDEDESAFATVDQRILSKRIGLRAGQKPRRSDQGPIRKGMAMSERPPEAGEASGKEGESLRMNDDGKADGQVQAAEAEEAEEETTWPADGEEEASVSHIVTNVIIFQSFLLELASLVQGRAGLFDEIRFA